MVAPLLFIIALLLALNIVQAVDNWLLRREADAAERRERINRLVNG